ncbi:unnamed protein product [Gongylonema pulchrum]|uniref:CTLH domain-containing protein n=1 Tax=Gongylonema pulchrum TaxID=637853 RepID=A0A183E0B6_9BILA|nr:unnamed protein product [Gongylonema pulchrum]
MARLLEQRRSLIELRQVLHSLLMKNPTFLPGQIEYSKALLMARDWERCMEQVQRTLLLQHDCLPVRLLDLFHELAVKGSLQATENSLREVAEIIQNNEARNHKLHYEIAQILFRTAPADHPAVKFARFFPFIFLSHTHF